MSFTRLGSAIALELDDGRTLHPRGSALYDPSGHSWPACSVLICSFEQLGEPIKPTKFQKQWFGKGYEAQGGRVQVPPRELSGWSLEGACRMIIFDRSGIEHGGDRTFGHPFGKGGGFFRPLSFGSGFHPQVFHGHGAYRVELGVGCLIDSRGFVRP